MSRYLIRCIEELPNVTVRTHTRVVALEGSGPRLERVLWRNDATGEEETRDIRHLFLMIGADPNTTWLRGCVALDDKGFVKTGNALSAEDLAKARWPLDARPIRWRRRSPASSPRATSARAASSALPRPSARRRPASSSSTRRCRSNGHLPAMLGGEPESVPMTASEAPSMA